MTVFQSTKRDMSGRTEISANFLQGLLRSCRRCGRRGGFCDQAFGVSWPIHSQAGKSGASIDWCLQPQCMDLLEPPAFLRPVWKTALAGKGGWDQDLGLFFGSPKAGFGGGQTRVWGTQKKGAPEQGWGSFLGPPRQGLGGPGDGDFAWERSCLFCLGWCATNFGVVALGVW